MNFKDLKRIIPKLKLSNLNSKTSQIKLAPSFRKEFIKLNSNKLLNSKKAAVIAALYEDDNKVRLILILNIQMCMILRCKLWNMYICKL